MWFFLVLLSLVSVQSYAGALCETGKVQCPKNFKCVTNVGCVPTNATCKCPQQACAWPLRCDCKGGCKQRECGSTRTCGTAVNPANACETSVCRNGKCVAAPLACDDCDRITGCPESQHSLTVSGGADADVDSSEIYEETYDDDDDDDHHDWDHHPHSTPQKNQAMLIGMGIFVGALAIIVIGFLLYLSSTASRA
jgi:hypothetical protein